MNRDFGVDQASSGEKEIINFVLGTFAFNIRSGLILVDEPELHLHPRWQHLLRDLFRELASDTKNQFVLASHSPAFITPMTIGNVRRIYKNQRGETKVCIPATTPVAKTRSCWKSSGHLRRTRN
jgi:putative ATP-dependent endonuclease of the OLD family